MGSPPNTTPLERHVKIARVSLAVQFAPCILEREHAAMLMSPSMSAPAARQSAANRLRIVESPDMSSTRGRVVVVAARARARIAQRPRRVSAHSFSAVERTEAVCVKSSPWAVLRLASRSAAPKLK